jgi:hypothetical protein
VCGHDVAARFVEDGRLDAGIFCAECFPVSKGCVEWRDVAIAYEYGLEVDLWALGVELVLRYDLCAQSWDVMTL